MGTDKNKDGQKLFPLRIDARTVIYVTEEKCNEAYAQRKRTKFSKGSAKASMENMAF